MKISIGLVDDHQLFLKSLSLMIESFQKYEVVVEALNGKDLQEKLEIKRVQPDLMLIDVNMKTMNGVDTAKWLSDQYPAMKLIALSMDDKDQSIISMFKAGCCAYILKDMHPTDLEQALQQITEKGYYNADMSNVKFRRLLSKAHAEAEIKLTDREAKFLSYACSELTYKAIAFEMGVSDRTVEGYRESLFLKFNVQSRVGLCLEALRKEFVKL
ncbi:MAG: response regulator transcription factor [Chitinophagaceae bacterium]|nr:MAG: response regulator transcription factor [Chitinophagaceae bacterium]